MGIRSEVSFWCGVFQLFGGSSVIRLELTGWNGRPESPKEPPVSTSQGWKYAVAPSFYMGTKALY